jgi:uncharacterized protein with ParB-like and HNH nuclease domain
MKNMLGDLSFDSPSMHVLSFSKKSRNDRVISSFELYELSRIDDVVFTDRNTFMEFIAYQRRAVNSESFADSADIESSNIMRQMGQSAHIIREEDLSFSDNHYASLCEMRAVINGKEIKYIAVTLSFYVNGVIFQSEIVDYSSRDPKDLLNELLLWKAHIEEINLSNDQ